ncbi:MAG: pitrilysin family protein [Bacteroidota bacterium]
MIEFSKFELANGLRVLVHEDQSTQMLAVNIVYDVGSKDESPDKTGFAHLFEHLMFGGSVNAPDFDEPLQFAGGESNAFTNNDFTNFYDIVPAANIETVLWLESDRMQRLNINSKTLNIQQKVVVEEFKETCLNQPFGDAWHHLSEMAFEIHPYRWPTIGLKPSHIADAQLTDVQSFFETYYNPNNAVLVIAGNITLEKAMALCTKWFGDIPSGYRNSRNLPAEPIQSKFKSKQIENGVPVDAMYMAFHMPGRLEKDYYAADLISDILANGKSSRLYNKLFKELQLFSSIDAYISGQIDPGLFIVEGKFMENQDHDQAIDAVWKELNNLSENGVQEQELTKLKNKVESALAFSESSILNKAMNLAYFEIIGNANLINEEANLYQRVTVDDIQRVAQMIFQKKNCSQLIYKRANLT